MGLELDRPPAAPRPVLMSGLGYQLRTAMVGSEKVDTAQAENANTLIVFGTDIDRSMITLRLTLPKKSVREQLLRNASLETERQLVMALSRGLQAAWNMMDERVRQTQRRSRSDGIIDTEADEVMYAKLIVLGKKGCRELDGHEA